MQVESSTPRRLGVWSFVLGGIGLATAVFGIGVVLAMAGVICAAIALSWLRPWHPHDGHGWALSGLMLGIAALLSFPLLLAIVVPRMVAHHRAAQAQVCGGNLRILAAAKERWAFEHGVTNRTLVRMEEVAALLSGGLPRCPAGGRYRINPVGTSPQCSIPLHNHANDGNRDPAFE